MMFCFDFRVFAIRRAKNPKAYINLTFYETIKNKLSETVQIIEPWRNIWFWFETKISKSKK